MWAWLLSLFKPDLITKVQAETVKACGFLPAVTTVSAIIATGNPQVASALAIANAICVAVQTLPGAATLYGRAEPPTVAGVPIEGEWVNK
jgi:hypothetical protein